MPMPCAAWWTTERIPIHSPRVAKIEVKRSGVVRRAKLYFLRERVGKAVRLQERRVRDRNTSEKN